MQPRHVHQSIIRQCLHGKSKKNDPPQVYKYDIGTWVRISKQWRTFSKGYLPSWSEEVFIVPDRRMQRQPVCYIADLNGEDLSGAFYEPKLQHVEEPSEYHVERVSRSLTTRGGGKEYFVKWKGWDNSFNLWVKDIYSL